MRITKSDVDSFPRFAELPEGMMTIDSLCFFSGKNLGVICKLLNSEYASYYFLKNIVTLDNGGLQMRQQYIEEIPIPNIKDFSDHAVFKAFRFTDDEIMTIREYIAERKKTILSND